MEILTYNTVETQGFLNLKEVLDTNTSLVKVTSSYSKNSQLPLIVLEIRKEVSRIKFDNHITGLINVDIHCLGRTKLESVTLAEEVQELIQTNINLLKQYNLHYNEHRSTPFSFERGEQRIHGTRLLYLFWTR